MKKEKMITEPSPGHPKPQGPVSFDGGVINLNGNTVELHGETIVTLGTTLNINQ